MPYAERTTVPAEKSRGEIERILERYGATAFSYGWEPKRAVVQFQASSRYVRFELPLPDRNDALFTEYRLGGRDVRRTDNAAKEHYEQAVRQRWRALALCIKAKLEAVEAGITDFEDEFLAHIVLPDGSTAGRWLRPRIAEVYASGQMPANLPALGAGD